MSIRRSIASLLAPGHPNCRLCNATLMALAFYSVTLVVFALGGIARGDYDYRDIYEVGVPMMIVDGLLAFSLFFLLERTEQLGQVRRWVIVVAGVLVVAVLQSAWDTQLRVWAGSVWADYGSPYNAFVRSSTLNTWHTGLFVALLAFQGAYLELRDKNRQLAASRAAERDAHLLALRFQLNPHFLFNTLNAISSLVVVGRGAEAEAMLDRLSSFLRSSLTADPHSLVRIDEEFDLLDTYLEIEGVRFGDRLVASIDLPAQLRSAEIPPFLLQPLVENAIKYAVAPSTRSVEVRIAADERNGELLLSVVDTGDGRGTVPPGTGIGLSNVRERLRLKYGGLARLDMQRDDSGCRVAIIIPRARDDSGGVPVVLG